MKTLIHPVRARLAAAVFSRIGALLGLWLALALPAPAQEPEEDGDLLSAALSAVRSGDWVAADHYARAITDPVGRVIVTWERLRRGEGGWAEYLEFLRHHGDWPGLARLRREGEEKIPRGEAPATVRAYFAESPPQTGTGALRLAEAFAAEGRTAEARDTAIEAWVSLPLTEGEEVALLESFGAALAQNHLRRLDFLLWEGHLREAERMLDRVPPAHQALARARIALQRASPGVDALIAAVPEDLADDPGLAYDRFNWRIKKNRWDDAQELLVTRSAEAEHLGRPEKWASARRSLARRAMRAGESELAYWLASQHGLTEGADFADLEWLAGYIALTKLDAPEQAAIHFRTFRDAVATPISLGRAGYWLGRAEEARGDLDAAVDAYRLGAEHQTSFYGQLAAERIAAPPDPALAGVEPAEPWQESALSRHPVVRAALLFHHAGEAGFMRWFLSHLAETATPEEAAMLADMALDLDRPHVALAVAKELASRGVILPRAYFPVTDLATYSADVDPEVALAIARRESEMNPEAVSPVGARGLMQIMPATARKVAEEIGVEYSKNRLTTDWRYNAKLGTAYLGGLLEFYEGSYVLAFAAYNAGPSRVERWIEQFGDPRDSLVDQVDWIEHIPFRETRNYVMRVMESLHVYRARLRGTPEPVRLSADLRRG